MSLESQLAKLETAQLVRTVGNREYFFKNSLTQETVYSSLLRNTRREIHRLVAETYAELYPDRLEQYVALIAQHYAQAGDDAKTLEYALCAGDQAARVNAYAEARTLFGIALKSLANFEATTERQRCRVDTLLKYVSVSYAAEHSEQTFQYLYEAESLAQTLHAQSQAKEDRLRLARAHYWLGRTHAYRNQMQQAMDFLMRVLNEAADSGDETLLAYPSAVIGRIMNIQGQFGAAEILLVKAFDALEKSASLPEWISTAGHLGLARAAQGKYIQGVELAEHAVAKAIASKNAASIAEIHAILAVIHMMGGAHSQMRHAAAECIRVAEPTQILLFIYPGYVARALAESRLGEHAAALASIARSEQFGRSLSEGRVYSDWYAAARAEIVLDAGHTEQAIELAQQAVELAQALGGIFATGLAQRVWARGLAHKPDADWGEIESHLRASLKAFEIGEARLEAARTHFVWGKLSAERKQIDATRQHLQQAVAQFQTSALNDELNAARRLLAECDSYHR